MVKTNDDLKKEIETLRDTLIIIAAQDSGIVGSTAKADCMAALAKATLRNSKYDTT